MDAATIEKLISLFAQLGEGSKEAFGWWLLAHFVLPYLLWFGFGCLVVGIAFRLIRVSSYESYLLQIRQITCPNWEGFYTPKEPTAVLQKIAELEAQERK